MLTALLLSTTLQAAVPAASPVSDTEAAETPSTASTGELELPLIEVRLQRQAIRYGLNSSQSVIAGEALRFESPRHPNEVFDRVPGAWISNASGQEHLTAIRSPMLSGAGACGAFMVLEDGVPTRPSGFCNINQLFETNLVQAQQVVVLRGPGTVTYGSNALHGAIEVMTPGPSGSADWELAVEAGADDYYRGRLAASGERLAVQTNFTDSGSFRTHERYQHGLFNLQIEHAAGRASGRTSLAYARLEQDTAGYILGYKTYKNNALRTQNLNPDAFREAWAARASSRWSWQSARGGELELIPYARSSRMDFLQHFLPGTPLESNGQDSAGVLFSWSGRAGVSAGADLEWAEGTLVEFQESALETGSAFLKATRPQGFHYDYTVRALTTAAWLQWQRELGPLFGLTAGLRAEHLAYDYDNRMLDGNTRDDGSECGFGGCLYTRPADRDDSFDNFSPELQLKFQANQQNVLYLRAARGYRAPQATELYRLQKGQAVADLDAETVDSLEIGLRGFAERLAYEVAAYAMRKRNFIFRDAEGFYISDGRTRHRGLEALLHWQPAASLSVDANLSWARHQYDFSRDLGSEVILEGNQIDTAPAWLGGLRLRWQRNERQAFGAEWVYQGDYYLDAANDHSYPGHSLLNLRGSLQLADRRHSVSLRLTNVLNTRYAERADYAFGDYRYFPGAGRRLSVEWRYSH